LADNEFAPALALSRFLDGDELTDVSVTLVRQQSASLANRAMRISGDPELGRGTGVLDGIGHINAERTRLTGFELISYVSDICFSTRWFDEEGPGPVFWDSQVKPVSVIPAMFSQRILALKIAANSLKERLRGPRDD